MGPTSSQLTVGTHMKAPSKSALMDASLNLVMTVFFWLLPSFHHKLANNKKNTVIKRPKNDLLMTNHFLAAIRTTLLS
jgi:hypothetical protein